MIEEMKSLLPVYRFKVNLSTEMLIKHRLYTISLQKGIYPEDSELNVLMHLYLQGPIISRDSNKEFLKQCVELKLRGSEASTRNVLSKYTCLGILVKDKNCNRRFNDDLLPDKIDGDVVFEYLLSNLDIDAHRSKKD